MNHPEIEPVGQAVNAILGALDVIAAMAKTEKRYDEVAAEKAALWQIINNTLWILSYLKDCPPPEPPKLRVVK
jgi:hypothetical protein